MVDATTESSAESSIRTLSGDEELVHERRQFIAECALPLFMKNGFHRTSVRQITKACNMSIGALYHYIGSKDDIGLLLAEQMRREMIEFMGSAFDDPRPVESLRSTIAEWCRLCNRLQDNVLFLYREFGNIKESIQKRIVEVDDQCIEMFEKVLVKGVNAGVFRISNTRLFALNIYVCGNMWAFRRWYLRPLMTLDQYIEDQTDLLMASALANR